MSAIFGRSYAAAYDAIYAGKNYEEECDFIEAALRQTAVPEGARILDLGCGTGGHTLPLARRGYQVTGVDRAPAMIEAARVKAAASGLEVAWHLGDVRSTRIAGVFDAVLLMFAVLGYQTTNDDVLHTLQNARRHLRPGGTLMFDVWYGAAVLGAGPNDRVKVVEKGTQQLVRAVSSVLHHERNVVDVHIRTWEFNGDKLESRADEVHAMRYFFPVELDLCLAAAGFRLNAVCAFPSLHTPPDLRNWNLGCVAVATESPSD